MLEIDARLPSQTPTAVFHACGVNIVGAAGRDGARRPAAAGGPHRAGKAAATSTCVSAGGAVEVLGEHMMGAARPLRLVAGLYGADEVHHRPAGGSADDPEAEWVATIIASAPDAERARAKARAALDRLAEEHGLAVTPETSAQPGDDCR